MRKRYLGCVAAAAVLITACLVDSDDRCGERQKELEGPYVGCTCEPGYVFTSDGKRCVECGAHEIVRDNACVCDEGYSRARAGESCEATADAGMSESTTGSEVPAVTGEGTACTTSADCEGLYATYCVTLLPPSTCVIQGCASGERKCPGSSVCFSFADFAPLASTNGICTPPTMCISPGKQVDP